MPLTCKRDTSDYPTYFWFINAIIMVLLRICITHNCCLLTFIGLPEARVGSNFSWIQWIPYVGSSSTLRREKDWMCHLAEASEEHLDEKKQESIFVNVEI